MKLSKLIAASFSAATLLAVATAPSPAMTINTPAIAAGEITQVAQGCGPNGHRGPYGHCRRLYTCPPGWHTGPYGKVCTRNRY